MAEPTEAIPQSPSRPQEQRSLLQTATLSRRRVPCRDPPTDSSRALSMQQRGFWGSKADQTAPGRRGSAPTTLEGFPGAAGVAAGLRGPARRRALALAIGAFGRLEVALEQDLAELGGHVVRPLRRSIVSLQIFTFCSPPERSGREGGRAKSGGGAVGRETGRRWRMENVRSEIREGWKRRRKREIEVSCG